MKRLCLFLTFCTAFCVENANAGAVVNESKTRVESSSDYPFVKGTFDFEAMVGPVISFTKDPHERPAINYVSEDLRLGVMLSTPGAESWLRGNTELFAEVFGGEIYQGPGNGLVGGMLLLRYNFVQPATRLHPYAQIGAGGVYNDIYKNHAQRLIGAAFEFSLQAGAGVQYMLGEKWAFCVEADYRHISNAGLAARNLGLNSVGGLAGFSFFF